LRPKSGLAIDVLIVAAISTMRVESLQTFLVPVLLLFVLAAIWCGFCLIVLARRLLPPAYWFELGLLNYGFATANTPQGMMLLRIVDPEFKSGAAEDYAVAAPLSAPFVGGGIVTILLLPMVLQRVDALVVAGVLVACMLALYVLGRKLRRPL
jgi:ESS family glutamate:Na+ symporter